MIRTTLVQSFFVDCVSTFQINLHRPPYTTTYSTFNPRWSFFSPKTLKSRKRTLINFSSYIFIFVWQSADSTIYLTTNGSHTTATATAKGTINDNDDDDGLCLTYSMESRVNKSTNYIGIKDRWYSLVSDVYSFSGIPTNVILSSQFVSTSKVIV